MTFLCLTLTPLFCKKLAGDVRWPLPSPICRLARALSDLHGVWCPATGLYPPRSREFLMCWFAVNCKCMKWHQWEAGKRICLWWATALPGKAHGVDPHCFHRSPPKGWGRIQRIYLVWENRRTEPKWTGRKKGEVIRKFGPWMDFWMLKGIRKIPVHKTWTKYVVDRDWFRVPAGTPGPDGLKACVSVCQMLQPGQKVKGFTPKKRHQAAWTYGKFLSKKLVKKLLDY